MTLFIASSSNDYHAAAACWSMKEAGYSYVLWEGLGHELARQATIEVIPQAQIKLGSWEVTKNDVFWYRRPRNYSYHPKMVETDRKFVRPEGIRFGECLDCALESLGCRCVNPPTAARAITRKAAQLMLALRCELIVPRTLMTNSVENLRQWMAAATGYKHIYKGFQPHVWSNSSTGIRAFAQTVKMPENIDCLEDQLSFAPGIYQSMVEKVCDVRVVVAGSIIRAFKIVSSELDWRLELDAGRAQAEEIALPDLIRKSICRFMSEAAIVTGSFDFGVDADGEWWFFEINETGQFLWIDQVIPSAGLLQDFLSFLTGQSRDAFPPLSEFVFNPTEAEPIQDPSSLVTVEV